VELLWWVFISATEPLAWLLSEIEIGDDATPPVGVSVIELRSYVKGLIQRLTEIAYPG